MSSPYPILENKSIDKWKVTELREELKKRNLNTKGLKEDLLKRLNDAISTEDGDITNNSDLPQSDEDNEGTKGSLVIEKTEKNVTEVTVSEVVDGDNSASMEEFKQVVEETVSVTPVISLNGQNDENHEELQVKSDSVSINEKIEIKENIIAEEIKLDENKSQTVGDLSSPEKLNLEQSSGDDSMEEDLVVEIKPNSDEKIEVAKVNESEGIIGITETEKSEAESTKRKLNDESVVGPIDVKKRQRKWNNEAVKLPVTPKDNFTPTYKGSFSKPASMNIEEAPKERVVPPSLKGPTDSLRIDRFLRPFTLKAVQELLNKTGSVTSFWMDQIKTHCYVTYSSIEEAIETRNALYNLQWPTNGGHLLIAEFVDSQDVKLRICPPTNIPPPQPIKQAQPIKQGQPIKQVVVQKQFLPPPPPQVMPPVQELPPPPPPKVEAPVITLDDIFRKTKATPRIYYLPLSDEQVAGKVKKREK